MTALEWVHLVLKVAILLMFVGYIYLLVKVTQLEYVGGLVGKIKIRVFGISFGFLVVVYLLYNLYNIQPTDWVQISLMVGLVGVTSIYALSTLRQADASVKMAEEMRKQRYDAVRPVIDIKRDTAKADIDRRSLEAYAASSGETVHELSCILRNIGLGPAIDGCSFFQHPERERLPWEFGTLASGEKTERRNLSIKHEGNRMALVACYRDVYDRCFESSREVSIEKKPNPNWVIGPLKIRPVKEEESKPK